jgi:hypothetical protein
MNQETQKIVSDLPNFHNPKGPALKTFPHHYFQLGHQHTNAFALEGVIKYNVWDLLDTDPGNLGINTNNLFILLLPDVLPVYKWNNEEKHWNKIIEDIYV